MATLDPIERNLSLMGKIDTIYKVLGMLKIYGAYLKAFVDEDTTTPYFQVNSDGDLEVTGFLIGKLQNTNSGAGAPTGGTDGDIYIDTTNNRLYVKIGGSWEYVGIGSGGSAPFTIEDVDGSPTVNPITKLIVGEGDLTDNGSGEVRILTANDAATAEGNGSLIYAFDVFH